MCEKRVNMGNVLVVMPCYNSMHTVVEAIDSVVKQTYKEYLLVCCDDSSTDGTYVVLKGNQVKFGYKLMQNKNNMGTGDTVNKVIEEYSNNDFEFVTWVSSDNILDHSFLYKHVKKLNDGYAVTYCGWTYFTESVANLFSDIKPNHDLLHLKEAYTLGPGFVFRKKLWDVVKPFHRLPGEDYYFAVKCALVDAKFGYIDDILVKYKDHNNSVSGRLKSNELTEVCSDSARLQAKNINITNGGNGYL